MARLNGYLNVYKSISGERKIGNKGEREKKDFKSPHIIRWLDFQPTD
jgi:hypothetical protein